MSSKPSDTIFKPTYDPPSALPSGIRTGGVSAEVIPDVIIEVNTPNLNTSTVPKFHGSTPKIKAEQPTPMTVVKKIGEE